jgi:hypothetical protein
MTDSLLSCSQVKFDQHLRGAYCLRHQGGTERRGRVVKTPSSYSEGPVFKPRPGHPLPEL